MKVAVGKGKSKTKTPGAYRYDPNPKGEGGAFVEDSPEHVDYWYLSVDGAALAGVWMDEASAQQDAETLRHLFATAGNVAAAGLLAQGATALQVRSGEKGGNDVR
jgi:hypothetical protein